MIKQQVLHRSIADTCETITCRQDRVEPMCATRHTPTAVAVRVAFWAIDQEQCHPCGSEHTERIDASRLMVRYRFRGLGR